MSMGVDHRFDGRETPTTEGQAASMDVKHHWQRAWYRRWRTVDVQIETVFSAAIWLGTDAAVLSSQRLAQWDE